MKTLNNKQQISIFIQNNIFMAKKTKIVSKLPTIKKLIALDPFHPGSISCQQYTKANGKKTKKYYTWQSSFQGKKKSVRIPENQVEELKSIISNATKKAETMLRKEKTEIVAYNSALKELMKKNATIRNKTEKKEKEKE